MPADFLDVHHRHWDDAERLFAAQRWANADHLYGMAAECGLKRLMRAFGMPFDSARDRSAKALRAHADSLPIIGPLLVNRDLNGRVRLVVGEPARTDATAKQALDAIAHELQAQLGPHACPAENAVLFEADWGGCGCPKCGATVCEKPGRGGFRVCSMPWRRAGNPT